MDNLQLEIHVVFSTHGSFVTFEQIFGANDRQVQYPEFSPFAHDKTMATFWIWQDAKIEFEDGMASKLINMYTPEN